MITEGAQLGISPISPARMWLMIGLVFKSIKNQSQNKDKEENVDGMNHGTPCDTKKAALFIIVAVTVLFLAQISDTYRVFICFVVGSVMHMNNKIDYESGSDTNDCLYNENFYHRLHRKMLGDKKWYHLIRCRKIDGNQCTKGYYSSGIQVRSGRRKTTLRKDSKKSADKRPEVFSFLYKGWSIFLGFMLKILHCKVG